MVEIIPNEHGNRSTPSVVAFDTGQRHIGERAKSLAVMNTENTLSNFKRLIARDIHDPALRADVEVLTCLHPASDQ
eukprot:m.11468 g.11468  ORF g.11468 m.11468 type:complete len:76 (+) comp9821_c1_seq3:208-435(+)